MKIRWKKFALGALLAIIALLSSVITFTIGWRSIIGARKRALTDRKIDSTPARLARGKYLVDAVAGCYGCHTDADWSKRGAPAIAGREGSGHVWTIEGLPWLVSPNITPDKETGIGNWSDDALARAIREGIGHDGRALFPMMPYQDYRQMSDEDVASIIVYLRSRPAIRNQLPMTKMPFPLNFLMQNMPQPLTAPVAPPDQATPVARGAYLVRLGACTDCHTPQEDWQPIAGLEFAGGFVQTGANGEQIASANITPAPSGISYYNESIFLQAMREGRVGARELHSEMPWIFYGKMTDDDLKSVYAYLKTLKPVKHQVDNTEPPTYCRLCKQKHGSGATN
jgi:mono/diheme cytochrome c family protein